MNLIDGPHNDVVQVYIDGSGPAWCRAGPDRGTFDGFYAPVDNQPTTNKAKAGQTIPLKWRVEGPSFATSWEDYYRYDKESNGGPNAAPPADPINGYGTRELLCSSSRLALSPGRALLPIRGHHGYLIDNVSYESAEIRRCQC